MNATQNSKTAPQIAAMPFGEFLCDVDLLSEEQLLQALGDHWSNGGNIGVAICRQGFLNRDELEAQAKFITH